MSLFYQVGTGASAVGFYGTEVPSGLVRQSGPGWRSGFEIGRDTRENVLPFVYDDLSGGYLAQSGFFAASQKNKVYYNQGLMVHIPRLCCLPFKSTAQTAMDDVGISAFRDANKRVHSLMSSLGVSGQRFLATLGKHVYIDTSLTNPALTLGLTMTDSILSVANLKLNATDYTAFSTDGTTNDTLGVVDVTDLGTTTSLVTHAHADDGFFVMDFFANLGNGGWNVFGGVLNQVNGFYAYPSTAVTLPLTSSTIFPIVYKDTKDIEGISATTVTVGPKNPTKGTIGNRGDSSRASVTGVTYGYSYWGSWGSPSNILASDNAYATASSNFVANADTGTSAQAPTGIVSDELIAYGPDFSAEVPVNAIITNIKVEVEIKEASAGDEIFWVRAQPTIDGSPIGVNLADGSELGTSDAYKTFEARVAGVTGANIHHGLGFVMQFVAREGASQSGSGQTTASGSVTVDHVRFTVSYEMPGTRMSLPQGSWSPGKPAHRANRLAIIHPATDEVATVTKPRIVTFLDIEYEPDRLFGTFSQPPTQLPTVDDAEWFQGGLAVSGSSSGSATTGWQVKLIDDQDVTRDLGFPGVHGTTPIRVAYMRTVGAVLMAYVCNTDSTDTQLWMYWNGRWSAFGALFSKTLGGAMSTQPLSWAERTHNTHQNVFYAFYPSGIAYANSSALLSSLGASWSLQEASGTRLDRYGANHLTDNNTVTGATGPGGGLPLASQFTAANSEYLSIADNAALSTGDIDFTLSAWVYLDSEPAQAGIIGRFEASGDQREYLIDYLASSDRLRFLVSSDGTEGALVSVSADNLGAVSASTWYFVVAWHDASANTINIQVNNGTADSTSHNAGVLDSTAAFHIGEGNSAYFNGRIAGANFWKRVLTSDERTALYNSGTPPAFTETGVIRQFVPPDPMNADPFLSNTSQVKQDGPLYVQGLELEPLPSEANNAIMALQVQSRRVDNNTSYGSVKVAVNTAGDHAFSTSHIDETFDAAAETFTDRNLSSSGDPGVDFKTIIPRFTLDHQTGTSETPNALPVILYLVSAYDPLEEFDILLAPAGQPETPVALAKRLRALMTSKTPHRFLASDGSKDIPVKVKPYKFVRTKDATGADWSDMQSVLLSFEQVPGSTGS